MSRPPITLCSIVVAGVILHAHTTGRSLELQAPAWHGLLAFGASLVSQSGRRQRDMGRLNGPRDRVSPMTNGHAARGTRVFIGFNENDSPVADRLHVRLQQGMLDSRTFRSQQPGVGCTRAWSLGEIDAADCIVFLFSAASIVKGKMFRDELEHALLLERERTLKMGFSRTPILIVDLDGSVLSGTPPPEIHALRNRAIIDLRGIGAKKASQRLFDLVVATLQSERRGTPGNELAA